MANFITKFFQREKQRYGGFTSGGSVPPDFAKHDLLTDYLTIGWLHAVIFRIALGCSEVKWRMYKGSDRSERTQVKAHPILNLLDKVNPFMTSPEFIALDTIYQELLGESFWILNYNALGEPAEIVLPNPMKMWVVPDKALGFVKGYMYGHSFMDANAIPLDLNDVIHFKYPSPINAFRGASPAQSIGLNLQAEKFADKWRRNFFYNSARPDGVIQFEHNLSDEQFDRLKKQWGERYKGVDKAHQVALLEGGGKYLQIQNTVKDMDFSNLSQKNRDVILGVYGMPQSVMGISENVNKANAEAGDYTFARWIVKPRLDWKKAKLQEQLLPKFRNSGNLEIDFDEVVPETVEQKKDLAESGMRAGYLTINEARKLQGLDPLPNGDVLLIPLNLLPTPIDNISASVKPTSTNEENPEKTFVDKDYTAEQKEEIWNRYAQKTSRLEGIFTRVFGHVWEEQRKKVLAYFKLNNDIAPDLNDDKTADMFKPVIELAYTTGYDDALSRQFDMLDEIALEWIASRSFLLATSINKTTILALREALKTGFEQGESIRKISKRLEGYFKENERWRAEMVARTEVISANNEGALYRYEKEGIDKSEFYPAPDACTDCLRLIGEYPTKESHGMIPVHPNCRCTFLPVV